MSGRRSTRSNTPVVLAVLALMAALIVAATVNAPSFRAAAKRRQAAAPVASVSSNAATVIAESIHNRLASYFTAGT